jgi:hypothetical protein
MAQRLASAGNAMSTFAMQFEPLYDTDPHTGATVEIFFADYSLAKSFGIRGAGWYWWSCWPGCRPDGDAFGPFPTSYRAYRDALGSFG